MLKINLTEKSVLQLLFDFIELINPTKSDSYLISEYE